MALRKFSAIEAMAEKHHGKAGLKKLLEHRMDGAAKDLKRSDDPLSRRHGQGRVSPRASRGK